MALVCRTAFVAKSRPKRAVLGCLLRGSYGLNDTYVGVPTVIGAGGIERIVEIALNKEEKAMFEDSVEAVAGLVDACKGIESSLA